MYRILWLLWTYLLLLGSVFIAQAAEPIVIKFATLAPEGTPWMNIMEEMNEELQQKSAGQVSFRFYAGGVAGDERDVLRKMRIQQLHGGAFSGFGLGEVLSDVRVLELPLLFHDAAEAEHVANKMLAHFTVAFAQKGYTLLSLNESGAVYIFSKDLLRTREDLIRAKLWTWQGDPLPQAIFKAYGVTPVPLSLPNVLPSLQSGLIDACYATPLSVLALQWFSKVKYRTSLALTHVMGALLLSDHLWQQLSPAQQTLVRETVHKYSTKAANNMRQYDGKALSLLQTTAGIQTTTVPDEEVQYLRKISEQIRQELAGQLYPQALLEQVITLRDQYRQRPQ